MSTQRREFYKSVNGDRWFLCMGHTGHVMVLHQANESSGGHLTELEVSDFLKPGYGTPERAALLQLIGELISPGGFPKTFR